MSKRQREEGAKMGKRDRKPMSEILPASIIPVSVLKIGSWERISMVAGDLEAHFSDGERVLRWELVEIRVGICGGAVKSRIEINFSDIWVIRAIIFHNGPGILDIELHQPPLLFQTYTHPRNHHQWKQVRDFTGGEASTCRRHYVKFPPGALDEHYELLLQHKNQLNILGLKYLYFQPEIQTKNNNPLPETPNRMATGTQTVVDRGGNDEFHTPTGPARRLNFIKLAPEGNRGGKENKNDNQLPAAQQIQVSKTPAKPVAARGNEMTTTRKAVDAAEPNGGGRGGNGEFHTPTPPADASSRTSKFKPR